MDQEHMDSAMMHAERKLIKTMTKFFLKFYGSRVPSAEELSALFGVSPEEAIQVIDQMTGGEKI
jgi:hypothetical protein